MSGAPELRLRRAAGGHEGRTAAGGGPAARIARLAGRIRACGPRARAGLAFLAGALAVLTQPPFGAMPLLFVSLPLLVWLLDGAGGEPAAGTLRRRLPAFAVGWFFGFGYFLGGLWWLGRAVLLETEAYWWALPLAVLALPAVLAVFFGLATALARIFWSDGIGRIAGLAFAFALAEWLRSFLFTGFPWNSIGQAAMPVPLLMQSASLLGPFAMSALAVFAAALPALAGGWRHRRAGLALAAVLVGAHAGYGAWRLAAAAEAPAAGPSIRIVQPSIDQSRKWDSGTSAEIFRTYLGLTASAPDDGAAPPDLILWPETAVPFLLAESPRALEAIGDVLAPGQTLLAGAVRREAGPAGGAEFRYYNSLYVLDAEGRIVDAADKVHLVPFGEYLPFAGLLEGLGLSKIVTAPSSFSPGEAVRPLSVAGMGALIPLICYEVIFPQLVRGAAAGADALVNVTNDAWYGRTPGPYQHLRQSQLRAAELGIPVLRAANNGVSAVIDGYGRMTASMPLDAVGRLDAAMPATLAPTPYARFGNLGFAAIMAVLAATALGLHRRQPETGFPSPRRRPI